MKKDQFRIVIYKLNKTYEDKTEKTRIKARFFLLNLRLNVGTLKKKEYLYNYQKRLICF